MFYRSLIYGKIISVHKMKKNTKTSNLIPSVNEIISLARESDVVHLYTENEHFDGRSIIHKYNSQNKDLPHFLF